MLLSVSMIVKNEEKHLPRCLSSIQGLADEIIVVDTGSSDRSLEIASAFGAKVFQFKWTDDFAAARNASLAQCTGDWVLILDADEAIDPTDHPNLRSLLTEHGPQAYRICCRNYLSNATQTILDATPVRNTSHYNTGREFDYYIDYVIHTRLFRRFADVQFWGRIHEVVDPYFEHRGIPVALAPVILHHFGKLDRDREAYKEGFYLDLCERETRANPDNYLALFHLILQSKNARKWTLCLDAVERFTRLRNHLPTLVLLAAGHAHQQLGDTASAALWIDRALSQEPTHAEALTLKARCLVDQQSLQEAINCLERAVEVQPGYAVPYINLAEVYMMQEKPEAARDALLRGIHASPNEETLYVKLVHLDCHQGRLDRATASAARAISAIPGGGDGLWHRLVAMGLLQTDDKKGAAAIVALGRQAFPQNEALQRLETLCTPVDDSEKNPK